MKVGLSFIDKWIDVTYPTRKDWLFFKILRFLRITKAAKLIYNQYKEIQLVRKYGLGLKGQLTVYGTTFNFHDPYKFYFQLAIRGRTYEPAVTYHMKSIIADRKCCFLDIGAYIGIYTAYIGTLNKNCELYSFEPSRKYFKILCENVKMNNINAKVYNIALSDKAGEIPFSDRSMKVLSGQIETVESIPFDELAARENIVPDIAKIDVHGGEGKVLYGMKNALRNHIRHVYCEIHPNVLLIDYSMKDTLDILIESGFELFEIGRFRTDRTPRFDKMTESLYNNIIDDNNWSEEQKTQRRMVYGIK